MPVGFNVNVAVGAPNTPGPGAVSKFSDGDNPYFETPYSISGLTRTATGESLGSCTCILYRIVSPVESRQEQSVVSDAEGFYSFNVSPPPATYRVTFDTDIEFVRAGLTLNTLTGT